jgi:hypothetical protein
VRFSADGGVVVFTTTAAVPGYNDTGGFEELYRFDSATGVLSCASCPSVGLPVGDAVLSNDDAYAEGKGDPIDSRGISNDGSRVFFDTPNALVPQDINGARDVYEWEGGHVYLLSSGVGSGDSFFLDNTSSGDDVFFATTDMLAAGDTDGDYDVYDASVNGSAPAEESISRCQSNCQGAPSVPPTFPSGGTASVLAGGNPPLAGSPVTVSPAKAKPKPKKRKAKPRRRRKVKAKHRARAGSAAGARVGAAASVGRVR